MMKCKRWDEAWTGAIWGIKFLLQENLGSMQKPAFNVRSLGSPSPVGTVDCISHGEPHP